MSSKELIGLEHASKF